MARSELAVPATRLAPRLVGAVVVSEIGIAAGEDPVRIRLSEVEAYTGGDDPASHAFRGPTPRTAVMFGPPGHLYCYFSYGMHWCANVVVHPEGAVGAVLLRAGTVLTGLERAASRRPAASRARDLARGPARLARCLALDAAGNGLDLCDPASPVRLESVPRRRRPGVLAGPRVGISVATERAWRFWRDGDPTVSPYTAGARRRAAPDPAD